MSRKLGATLILCIATGGPFPSTAEPIQTVTAGSGPTQPSAPSVRQFIEIRAPGSPTLALDGRLYVQDWPDGINQLYRRHEGLDPDAPLQRLTDYEHGIAGYSLSPDGRYAILSVDAGGDEQWDLHLLDTASDVITPLKADPRVRYRFQLWSKDSKGFVYAANEEKPTDFHLYRHDIESGERERIFAGERHWFVSDMTDDGSRMLLGNYTSVSESDAFELDVSTGDLRPLNVQSGYYNIALGYLPGEDRVAVVSDATKSGRRKIHLRCLESGDFTFAEGLGFHEVEGWTANLDRSLVAVRYNQDAYSTLRVYTLPSMEPVPIPSMERGVVYGVSFSGSKLIYQLSNSRTPGITYVVRPAKPDVPPKAVTSADDQGLDLSAFELPRLISYESFDGMEIPAFLYLPPGYEEGSAIPFVAHYHGGPESQFRPWFNRQVQYLLSRGYGVIQPNVRGSTGYGRAFHMADVYERRWDSVRDGVEAVRWLIENGYTREGMVGAYGVSYGGFMAVATIIEGQGLFGASINRVGIVNFRTFLERTGAYRRHLREAQYGPLSDGEFLDSISPINRIDEIDVPMMIVHGLNDPRVPVCEAMQLAVGLQRRGHDPELLFFPDEGHGLSKLENRLLFLERMARFLERHIGTKPAAGASPASPAEPDSEAES